MDAVVPLAGERATRREAPRIVLVGAVLAMLGAVGLSASVALDDAADQPVLVASARAIEVGVPIAVGFYAWVRADERFGRLLVAVGAAWFVTTLAESDDEWLYSVGRSAGWLVEVMVVYLILSFPTGRLLERVDRILVVAMGAAVLTMFLPRLALARAFEVPSPYTSCIRDCPSNAFFVLDREPAFVGALMRPLGVALVLVVMIAVVMRLGGRIRGATRLTRRMLIPVLVVAMARAGAVGIALVARQFNLSGWALEAVAWLLALAFPVLALAFLGGLLQWRLFAERALQRLAEGLRGLPDAMTLRRVFAEAFDDPTIEIVLPARDGDDRWTDCEGASVSLPRPGSGRAVSEVRDRGSVTAAIVYDEGLGARPRLVEAGVAMAAVVLDNQRLAAEAAASLREVRGSRARIAASAERERRRIERDLHDGAQQRLVALRIELELAEELVLRDADRGAARLRELEHEVDEALEELRSLAHGVYPPLLADRGLADALRAVAARSTIAIELEALAVARYPAEVEGAVYFTVLEALQNVAKHAVGARRAVVCLDGGWRAELRFSVQDDGAGAPGGNVWAGGGVTNMRDRLGAIGGAMEITSTPGVGTVVRGRVPTGAHDDS
jgi:signal transduction histidine kinase